MHAVLKEMLLSFILAYFADNKRRPENTAVILGNEAFFSCYFGNSAPDWRFAPVGSTIGNSKRILTLDGYNVTPPFQPYITVNNDRHNNSHLIINETKLEHAGGYHAHAAPELGGIQKVQLIILGERNN